MCAFPTARSFQEDVRRRVAKKYLRHVVKPYRLAANCFGYYLRQAFDGSLNFNDPLAAPTTESQMFNPRFTGNSSLETLVDGYRHLT